ncbi:MAG TPA: hypothetical protein DEH25_16470 [Chloroflexi bacterium]|nr:hypothetical protein [Chloroflexota bacterium]HBY07872.1 hypothetical protein [Chloroflexota bacterium]
MTLTGLLGFVFILIFFGLMMLFVVSGRSRPGVNLRQIPAFTKLRRAIGLAVEAGSRLHVSIGRGGVIGTQSASAFVGLSMLERLAGSASTGDKPPIATSGDGVLGVLAQDTLQGTYRRIGLGEQFDPTSSQVVGLTPFSFAAGTIPLVSDKKTGANILAGSFGSEVALITDAGERSGNLTLAGTDNLPAQSIIYATADEPLIGEELYAGGAYLNVGPLHEASLQAQDVLRWSLVAVILLGTIAKLFGLDVILAQLFEGLL